MKNTIKALSKQFFGAKYESARKSLLAAAILFIAIYAAEIRVAVAPAILYLTSTLFTAGVMWQVLTGRRQMEAMQGMLMLPFDHRGFVFGYVLVLGAHTLVTKTLLVWALFFAAASWNIGEIAVLPLLWVAGILAAILLLRQWAAVLSAAAVSVITAVLYLAFADAYDFYSAGVAKKAVRHTGRTGNVFTYLLRYLMANKTYLINTAGLAAVAGFLPLLFGEVQGMNMFPIGLAILCLNTPICTLLSCDPDLEQAIRVLPGQAGRFCRKYCLFIFAVNSIVACIYLCSWQLINSGTGFVHGITLLLFALQSAILSVILEWRYPIRGWKTESDLWHHPRKYLVPLIMLLAAALVGIWPPALWIWAAALLTECCVLLVVTRRD